MRRNFWKAVGILALSLLPLGCVNLPLDRKTLPELPAETRRVSDTPATHPVLLPVSNRAETGVAPATRTTPEYRTANFIVKAATPEMAESLAKWAEYHRREKALTWLGREMPTWSKPCEITIHLKPGEAGGAVSFVFDRGRVLHHEMYLEGSPERLVASGLPHEVTHLIFAHHFGGPLPRWADEGGAVWSEDAVSHQQHQRMCLELLRTPGRVLSLRRLFGLTEYPSDAMALYAQGYSVTDFLIRAKNPQDYLAFVADGVRNGWDRALQTHYGYSSVEELERAWLNHLRTNGTTLAANNSSVSPVSFVSASAEKNEERRTGWEEGPPRYLPEYPTAARRVPVWQPTSVGVRLGLPEPVDLVR